MTKEIIIGTQDCVDGYKTEHHNQYDPLIEMVCSNWTARSSRTPNKFTIFFGLQYFIKRYLIERFNSQFFARPKEEVVQDYFEEISSYLNNPNFKVDHIAALHDLGYLPLLIKALPEGAKVPLQVPSFTIRNTDSKFAWLTNFLETILSNAVWLPITSATTAYQLRKILEKYAEKTGGIKELIDWQAHDFSFRGMGGEDGSLASAGAHLLSFKGTDTVPAIKWLKKYYNATGLIGGSVPATEHSVMCAGSETPTIDATDVWPEKDLIIRLLTEIYPKGIVSVVWDTWDYFLGLQKIVEIKDLIMSRDGKLVIRPDSGDQVTIVCGHRVKDLAGVSPLSIQLDEYLDQGYAYIKYDGKYYELVKNNRGHVDAQPSSISEIEIKGTIEYLWDVFGGTMTDKGYKQLDSHIGCILGDGVTPDMMETILSRLEEKGFASTNMVFGIGSFTYQMVTRDTYGQAMKATFCRIAGVDKPIFKAPKTQGLFVKKSAKGLLQVKLENGVYVLHDQATWEQEEDSELQTVFKDGALTKDWTLEEIRQRVSVNK